MFPQRLRCVCASIYHSVHVFHVARLLSSPIRFGVLLFGALMSILPACAQISSANERSPDAVAILQRVLSTSGMSNATNVVHDVVVTATISGSANDATQAQRITISVGANEQFRVDLASPAGRRSRFYNQGRSTLRGPDGTVIHITEDNAAADISRLFPLRTIVEVLRDSVSTINLVGTKIDQESGHSICQIRINTRREQAREQQVSALTYLPTDYFIDQNTNQIVRIERLHRDRGAVPTNPTLGPFETYRFDDYRAESGIVLPHEITVSLAGRLLSTLHVTGYQFNQGLSNSVFDATSAQ